MHIADVLQPKILHLLEREGAVKLGSHLLHGRLHQPLVLAGPRGPPRPRACRPRRRGALAGRAELLLGAPEAVLVVFDAVIAMVCVAEGARFCANSEPPPLK